MGKHLIFAYGSLKRGFNRSYALRDQRYIGIACTEPKYAIFEFGGFPALVDENLAKLSEVQAVNKIYGELYEVDDTCIVQLDKIEGIDIGLFERKNVSLGSITMSCLPTNSSVWVNLGEKTAQSYFFKRNLNGAANCGSLWCQK